MSKYFTSIADFNVYVYELNDDLLEDGNSELDNVLSKLSDTELDSGNHIEKIKEEILKIKNLFQFSESKKYKNRFTNILYATKQSIHDEESNKKIDRKIIFTNILIVAPILLITKILFNNYLEQIGYLSIAFFLGYYSFWGFKRNRFPLEGFIARGFFAKAWSTFCLLVAFAGIAAFIRTIS